MDVGAQILSYWSCLPAGDSGMAMNGDLTRFTPATPGAYIFPSSSNQEVYHFIVCSHIIPSLYSVTMNGPD